jgi:3-phenylpropionate/cinnamic acid dioxygenase small subunit
MKERKRSPSALLASTRVWPGLRPPSHTPHLLANIEPTPGEAVSEITVYCNFIVYRSREETEQYFYIGARRICCGTSTARS